MKKIFTFLSLCTVISASFAFRLHPFGYESLAAIYNKQKIGGWTLFQEKSESIVISPQSTSDTLKFFGWCDSACLFGTVIEIRNSSGAKVARLSQTRINKIEASDPVKGKTVTYTGSGVEFNMTFPVFQLLENGKTYSLYLIRTGENGYNEHIFNLKLE